MRWVSHIWWRIQESTIFPYRQKYWIWLISAPSFMLQEVIFLTKPFSLFHPRILLFHLTPHGHSQNKTSWHLTDCICLLISETLRRVPLYWKTKKNGETSCSSHESDTSVAGSEFRFSRIHLVCRCYGLPRWANTVRPLLCASHLSIVWKLP